MQYFWWDNYAKNNQANFALLQYLKAYQTDETSSITIKKIANTYFSMHQYKRAYLYYSKLQEHDSTSYKNTILSYLYYKKVNKDSNIIPIISELSRVNLSAQDTFYYKNSLACLQDFHNCKQVFNDYFWPNIEPEAPQELSTELSRIKQAIENYRNFQTGEIYYKNALLIWAWFENWLYPLVIELWTDLLSEKPQYEPIIKLIAQSYFEIGNYKQAKKYLNTYNEIKPNEAQVQYLLWVINSRLWEYLLSNILLNKALESGYEPVENIYRRLIFSYNMLWDTGRMLSNFEKLIEQTDQITYNDILLAIYYHTINDQLDTAMKIVKIGNDLFPNNDDIIGFEGWIYKEKWEFEKAEISLLKAHNINKKNPLVTLNLWQLYILIDQKVKAKISKVA